MNRRSPHPRSKSTKELARPEPKPMKPRKAPPPPAPVAKPMKRADASRVDTTPPWPFPKREVVLKSSEWQAIWKKIRDRTSRDLERDNAQAQDTIKEALDQRDALQARVDKFDDVINKVLTGLGVHTKLATDLISELKSL